MILEENVVSGAYEIKDEKENLDYVKKHKLDKTLPKLKEELKNKRVLLYGAGVFLEAIKKHYDLSDINIIGISDKKYEKNMNESEFLGYKTYPPSEIIDLKPDYIVISTKMYLGIVEGFYNSLKKSKIKIRPLLKKSFWTLLKEAMR